MFPGEVGGWEKRQRASGVAPIDMREVPFRMGFNTGIPNAPKSAAGALSRPALDVRPIAKQKRKKAQIICLTCNLTGCVGRCRFQSVEAPPVLKSAQGSVS